MKQTLSENLIAISTMMMVAKDRTEIIHLAGELNSSICKAMEIERISNSVIPNQSKKTLSTTIKFTKKEIDNMSKTFKKEFIANGMVARIIKRPSGKNGIYYEIRYRRNGYNITVSNKDLKTAKVLFIEKTRELDPPEVIARNKTTFGSIADEWLEYKKGKIVLSTWKNYKSLTDRFFLQDLRAKQIREFRTVDLDRFMRQFENKPRKYEDIRIVLNSIFKYARASGIISNNPVELVPFKKAKRTNRKALTEKQIEIFLKNIKKPQFEPVRQQAFVFYFFGLRPCEIDKEAHFENGFLICRNRKRHGGKIEYKKIPVPKQAQEFINFNKPIKPPCSQEKMCDLIQEALPDKLTSYNLRHTFASTCAQYVTEEIVALWMGDTPESLVGQVYIHYPDKFTQEQMNKVKFIT